MASRTELASDYKDKTLVRKAAEATLRRNNSAAAFKAFQDALKAEAVASDRLSRYVSAETGKAPYERMK